jgi:5-methylcytosine-specific restriction protein B
MTNWEPFEDRIRELEAKRSVSENRRSVFEVIKASQLRPNPEFSPSLYLGPLIDLHGKSLCLEYTNDYPNLWFHTDQAAQLRAAGFTLERKPPSGIDSEGRHAGLKGKGFRDDDAWKLGNLDADLTLAALSALGLTGARGSGPTTPRFPRSEVEAAMDAYDRYHVDKDNTDKDLFDRFDEPRQFWVRSTRRRQRSVYPTKPIVGYILKTDNINGGWSQKTSAATRLYNAGYVIVDGDNKPSPPPQQFGHLIDEADRIRLCALNYYIEPAREEGKSEVSIRASDLATKMGLTAAHPNICQALGGEKFQKLARVSPPTHTEPNPSSSTVFTFKLADQAKAISMTDQTAKKATEATNLILYGPPGTGKTYHTAWEAVRLCLGDARAEELRGNDRREDLMAEYERLVEAERVEFVTFHQSMSYEEFVEGLRPTTGRSADPEAPQEEEPTSGFRLEPQSGIFKRICERAVNDRGDSETGGLDRTQRIYRLGLTGADWHADFRRAIEDSEIVWGFGGDIDWSSPDYEDWEAIKQKRKAEDPSVRGNHATVYGTWLVRFSAPNDAYVMLTVGRNKVVAFGRFAGDYRFTPASGGSDAKHSRPVEWIWSDPEGIDRSTFYDTPFTSFHPIYPLEKDQINWLALETAVLGAPVKPADPRPYVLIIDEINRANISKVFGELITLLEPDKRLGKPNVIQLTLPYSKKKFGVPANLHIIGTMNTADRSIALLDTALRRRFTFRELMPDPEALKANVDGIDLQKLLRTLNTRIEYLFDRDHQIGHAYFTECKNRDGVESVMRHKVIPLLAEYFYDDWSKVAAVLGDARQGKECFLLREPMAAPDGLEGEEYSNPRQRWRVRPPRDGNGNGGFDFTEFEVR